MSSDLSAISAVSGGMSVGSPDATMASHSSAVDKKPSAHDAASFASLMQSPDVSNIAQLTPASHAEKAGGPSIIEKIATNQSDNMRDLFQSSRDFISAVPHMSMAEVVSTGSDMSLKIAVSSTQFTIASSVGKSASGAVSTLMKNQ